MRVENGTMGGKGHYDPLCLLLHIWLHIMASAKFMYMRIGQRQKKVSFQEMNVLVKGMKKRMDG